MKKALLFLWQNYISMNRWINLVLGALVLGLNYLFPQTEFFSTYVLMYPLFPVIFLMIYGNTLTTLYRNLALGFQCRRTDFFWGSQVAFLVTGLGCAALTAAMGYACNSLLDLSTLAAHESFLENGILWADPGAFPMLLVLGLCLQPMGAALGSVYEKHKVIATASLIIIMLLAVAATVVTMFVGDGTIVLPRGILWGTCAFFVILALVGEVVYYRSNRKAVVR